MKIKERKSRVRVLPNKGLLSDGVKPVLSNLGRLKNKKVQKKNKR